MARDGTGAAQQGSMLIDCNDPRRLALFALTIIFVTIGLHLVPCRAHADQRTSTELRLPPGGIQERHFGERLTFADVTERRFFDMPPLAFSAPRLLDRAAVLLRDGVRVARGRANRSVYVNAKRSGLGGIVYVMFRW